jgi:hypothetical protein
MCLYYDVMNLAKNVWLIIVVQSEESHPYPTTNSIKIMRTSFILDVQDAKQA